MSESSSDEEPPRCACESEQGTQEEKHARCPLRCQSSEQANDNRRREKEKWAMLAGQHIFKFESYIFRAVLPEELIKPHIFPRNIADMFVLIEKYSNGKEGERLEHASEKWMQLCNKWEWTKTHEVVLATIKAAYLHITNPLEVMMRLDKEQGKTLADARVAFRNSLPPKLHQPGEQILVMMLDAGLLLQPKVEDSRAKSPSSCSLPSMHLSE